VTRVEWDEVWMRTAEVVAERSLCDTRRVGAVIVDASNRVVGTGYNGPPAPAEAATPCGQWCPQAYSGSDVCLSLHAEVNALMYSDRSTREGGTVYVTQPPCLKCTLAICNSGVRRLVYMPGDGPSDPLGSMWAEWVLRSCDLEVVKWQ
jgi:dCMP deaminase